MLEYGLAGDPPNLGKRSLEENLYITILTNIEVTPFERFFSAAIVGECVF